MRPEICPHCGAEVPEHAKACPECGADEQTGWADTAVAQRLGLPDEEFDYGEFVREEFGQPKGSLKPPGIHWFWWGAALSILAGLLALFVLRLVR